MVPNEMNELIMMDYKKFNACAQKDHFHMSFMDQMIGRLEGKGSIVFLINIRSPIIYISP